MKIWLIDETVEGNYLEWWVKGKCALRFKSDADIHQLAIIKNMLNAVGVKLVKHSK